MSFEKKIQSQTVTLSATMQVEIEAAESLQVRRALGVKWTQRLQRSKHVSGFGYLSEPDKWNDKQLLRDYVNVMLIDYPTTGLRWINPNSS